MEDLIRHALYLVTIATVVPLGLSVVCGMVLSFVQAVLQIQEQSSQYLLKLAVVSAALFFGGRWLVDELVSLFNEAYILLITTGKMHG